MTYLRRIAKAQSFRSLVAPGRYLWAKANDVVLNINTIADRPPRWTPNGEEAETPVERANPLYRDSVPYETPDYWYVRKIRRMLSRNCRSSDVFFDVGCGKGRILCVMARWPFKKIVGIELSEHFCACAKENVACLRGRHAPIEVICRDAATADLTEGTVYFLFNPFGRDTLHAVCRNIECSLTENPRLIRLVYYNAVHDDILKSCGWLNKYHEFETQSGLHVTFWQNESGTAGTGE